MRGDLHRLRSDRRAKGAEQQGARYAVVLQATHIPLPTIIVAPTTTNPVGARFWPAIEIEGTTSYVLVEQLMAVDLSRLGDRVGQVTVDEQDSIDDRVRAVLDL